MKTGITLPSLAAMIMVLIMTACHRGDDRLNPDLSAIPLPDATIHRYDQDLFNVDQDQLKEDLEKLKPSYRFFLDADLTDSAKLADMKAYLENPRNQALHHAVDSVFADASRLETSLADAFRHFLYYFPRSPVPRIYSYISGGDYDYPVQFADSVMLIGLDNFLGAGYKPYTYDGVPVYRAARMTPDHVVPACMKVLCQVTCPEQLPGNTLLEQMVEAGKRILFVDAMIPGAAEWLKIGYTQSQYDWIRKNEGNVWSAIIENRMLYSTEGRLIRTFMADGPFTAEFSAGSPPRLGEWIGWQIVKRYFEKQDHLTLQQVMEEKDAQRILNLSGYKPGK